MSTLCFGVSSFQISGESLSLSVERPSTDRKVDHYRGSINGQWRPGVSLQLLLFIHCACGGKNCRMQISHAGLKQKPPQPDSLGKWQPLRQSASGSGGVGALLRQICITNHLCTKKWSTRNDRFRGCTHSRNTHTHTRKEHGLRRMATSRSDKCRQCHCVIEILTKRAIQLEMGQQSLDGD